VVKNYRLLRKHFPNLKLLVLANFVIAKLIVTTVFMLNWNQGKIHSYYSFFLFCFLKESFKCEFFPTLWQFVIVGFRRTGVNFINILHTNFSYSSALHSFSLITVWLCNFWQKNIGAKAAHKMLTKLTFLHSCEINGLFIILRNCFCFIRGRLPSPSSLCAVQLYPALRCPKRSKGRQSQLFCFLNSVFNAFRS